MIGDDWCSGSSYQCGLAVPAVSWKYFLDEDGDQDAEVVRCFEAFFHAKA